MRKGDNMLTKNQVVAAAYMLSAAIGLTAYGSAMLVATQGPKVIKKSKEIAKDVNLKGNQIATKIKYGKDATYYEAVLL